MTKQPEKKDDNRRIYICRACGQAIVARLPRGLKGEFAHARCVGVEKYEVLSAEFLY